MRKHLLSSYLVLKKPCQEVFSEQFSAGEAGKIKTSCGNPLRGTKIKASVLPLPFWVAGAKSNNFCFDFIFLLNLLGV